MKRVQTTKTNQQDNMATTSEYIAEVQAWGPTEIPLVTSVSLYSHSISTTSSPTDSENSTSSEKRLEEVMRICLNNCDPFLIPESAMIKIGQFCDTTTALALRSVNRKMNNLLCNQKDIWNNHARIHQLPDDVATLSQFIEQSQLKQSASTSDDYGVMSRLKMILLGPLACTCTL